MDAYIGEMRLFPYTFIPNDWLPCDGRTVLIGQYQALYAVIGGAFGQPNNASFQLPNMQGRTAIGMGTGPGLTTRVIGQPVGTNAETVTLNTNQIPTHTHTLNGAFQGDNHVFLGGAPSPDGYFTFPQYSTGLTGFASNSFTSSSSANTTLAPTGITATGGSQGHPNMQPYLAVAWGICATGGEFPMRP